MAICRWQSLVRAVLSLALLCAGASRAAAVCGGEQHDLCGCSDAMGNCLDGLGHSEWFWVRGELLIWQLEGQNLPPLVTASQSTIPLDEVGRLDSPSTVTFSGGHLVNDDWRAGWGISGGFWADDCRRSAVVWDFMQVGRQTFDSINSDINSPPGFFLARPFFDVEANQQSASLLSGTLMTEMTEDGTTVMENREIRGRARVEAFEDFYSLGFALQERVRELNNHCERGHSAQLSRIIGYRHYHDDSYLGITSNVADSSEITTTTDSETFVDTVLEITNDLDSFTARNNFHGAELGLSGRVERWGCWLEGLSAFGLGNNHRTVVLRGETTVSEAPDVNVTTTSSGLLVSALTNAGKYSDDRLTIIPRLRGGVGCQLTPRISTRAGYSAIIWPNAVRAADHTPPGLAVDQRNLPGGDPTGATNNPRFPGLQGRTIVAHGFDLALEVRY